MARSSQPKRAVQYAVEMAVAALECHPSPSPLDDPDMRYVDPSPGSLDLPPPGKPDDRRAAETGAARSGAKRRSPRRKKRPPLPPTPIK
jgi:hypothetical protein